MPEQLSLLELIDSVDKDNLVIPDFQRGFKWNTADIRKLLESLLLDYPIGAALLWRTKRNTLEYRRIDNVEYSEENDGNEFEAGDKEPESGGVKEPNQSEEISLILDGQQRITSIYKLFPLQIAPNQHDVDSKLQGLRFFLDLNKLGLNADDIQNDEDTIKRRFKDPDIVSSAIVEKRHADLKKEYRHLASTTAPRLLSEPQILKICRNNNWLPLTRSFLENQQRDLRMLLNEMASQLTSVDSEQTEKNKEALGQWSDCFTSTIQSVLNKKVLPCLILKDNTPLEGLARIFETVNSTGMSLSLFDLLVAKLGNWPIGDTQTNLRKLLKDTFNKNRVLLQKFDDERDLGGTISQQIPKILALKADVPLKKGNILKIGKKQFLDHIDGLESSLEVSLETIVQEMGVIDQSYIPIKDWISIIGATYSSNWEMQKHTVIPFLWAICFTQNWDSSTNETLEKSYRELTDLLNGKVDKQELLVKLEAQFPKFEDVLDFNSKSTITYRAIMAFNLSRGGSDWIEKQRNTLDKMEDHHIFPQKWIGSNRDKSEDKAEWIKLRDCVLNRIFVSKEANSKATDSAPPSYLGDLSDEDRQKLQIPESFMKELTTPMKLDTFKGLLKERYNLINADFIASVSDGLTNRSVAMV